jgi:GntR family transcriptional regulator
MEKEGIVLPRQIAAKASKNTPAGAFSLDPASGMPVYRQIIRQIEDGILSGRLKTGDRLPTIRALAVELKVNPNTVAKVYGELEIRRIVNTQVGSGTFISIVKPEPSDDPKEKKIRALVEKFVRAMGDFGLDMDGIMEKLGEYGKSSCGEEEKNENEREEN